MLIISSKAQRSRSSYIKTVNEMTNICYLACVFTASASHGILSAQCSERIHWCASGIVRMAAYTSSHNVARFFLFSIVPLGRLCWKKDILKYD